MSGTISTGRLALLRVDPRTPATAGWWPSVQRRALAAIRQHSPEIPENTFQAFLHDRWSMAPETLGVWVGVRAGQLVSHALGWVEVAWGVPYLLLHQVIADAPVSDLMETFVAALQAWGADLNASYAAVDSPLRITKIEFWTSRSPGAMDRWLRGQSATIATVHTIPLGVASPVRVAAHVPRQDHDVLPQARAH